jgi:hypothetical protein
VRPFVAAGRVAIGDEPVAGRISSASMSRRRAGEPLVHDDGRAILVLLRPDVLDRAQQVDVQPQLGALAAQREVLVVVRAQQLLADDPAHLGTHRLRQQVPEPGLERVADELPLEEDVDCEAEEAGDDERLAQCVGEVALHAAVNGG